MSYLYAKLMRSSVNSWLKDRIKTIKTSPDGAQRWLRDLGKNGFNHAEAVEEYAGKILEESKAKLSPEETYLLLHAIYIHDVGHRRYPRRHPQRSQEVVTLNPAAFFIHDFSLAEAIGWLCAAHGLADLRDIPHAFGVDVLSRTEHFDLRLLGSLLMLADEMDQGYLRVFNTRGQEDSPRNDVYHVEIGPQIVKIRTRPTTEKQYRELAKITENIQARLEKVREFILPRGVILEHVKLYPSMWVPHKEATSQPVGTQGHDGAILFLLDRTVLGMQILQSFRALPTPTAMLPNVLYDLDLCKRAFERQCAAIVWVLGEDFGERIPREVLSAVCRNTRAGSGLVLFPFVAWSVAQGINDTIEEAVPVRLRRIKLQRKFQEGMKQEISTFEKHAITRGLKPFVVENTFEYLSVKDGYNCIVADSDNNPIVTVGKYGRGRVAYVNISSHLCFEVRVMPSPWEASEEVRNLVRQAIEWAAHKEGMA